MKKKKRTTQPEKREIDLEKAAEHEVFGALAIKRGHKRRLQRHRARFLRELAKIIPKEEKKIATEFGDGGVKLPKY